MFQNPNAAAELIKKAGATFTPIVPFAKVASNITGRAIEHTAPGAIASVYSKVHKFAQTEKMPLRLGNYFDFRDAVRAMPAADRASLYRVAARGIIGTGVSAGGYALYNSGTLNAPEPKRGEYGSVNAFGKKWEVGRVLGPYATPLFLGAELARAKEQKRPMNSKDVLESLTDNAFSNPVEMMQSLTETAPTKAGKPTGTMKVAASLVGTQIPSVVRATAGAFDPTHSMRDKDTDVFIKYLWNSIKTAIPRARETLPVKKDRTGTPIPEAATMWPVPRHVAAQTPEELAATRARDDAFARGGHSSGSGRPHLPRLPRPAHR
jgi:hypothetical protein